MPSEFNQALDAANKAIECAFYLADTNEDCQRLARKLELYSECLASRGAALLEFLELIDDEKRRKLIEFFEQSSAEMFVVKQNAESGDISQAESKRRILEQIDRMKREIESVDTVETHPRNRISTYYDN